MTRTKYSKLKHKTQIYNSDTGQIKKYHAINKQILNPTTNKRSNNATYEMLKQHEKEHATVSFWKREETTLQPWEVSENILQAHNHFS